MEPEDFYQQDTRHEIHQGAIYEYRPFFWLDPPLYLLRNFTKPRSRNHPGHATVLLADHQHDAFAVGDQENQEDVRAVAKARFLIVLSNDNYLRRPENKDILVAPIFSYSDDYHERFARTHQRRINGELEGEIYLPPKVENGRTVLKEGYIKLKQAKTIKKDFLDSGKLHVCVTKPALGDIVTSLALLFI